MAAPLMAVAPLPPQTKELRPPCSFLGLAAELRIMIYTHLFANLIAEYPRCRHFFAVFELYDGRPGLYDDTLVHCSSCSRTFNNINNRKNSNSNGSNIKGSNIKNERSLAFRSSQSQSQSRSHYPQTTDGNSHHSTGLTALLRTCHQIHDEALPVLCSLADFYVDLYSGTEALDRTYRSSSRRVKMKDDGHCLALVRHLKLNVLGPADNDPATIARYLAFLRAFLGSTIRGGAELASLELWLFGFAADPDRRLGAAAVGGTLEALEEGLRAMRERHSVVDVKVYLGGVRQDQLIDEKAKLFCNQIQG